MKIKIIAVILMFSPIMPLVKQKDALCKTGICGPDMMKNYLLKEVDQYTKKWINGFEQLKTTQEISEHQENLRKKFIEAIGGLPNKSPLNPQITGTIDHEHFRVEKVIIESQPKHHITTVLFLPKTQKYLPPYPAVLVACGHSNEGKATIDYQKACILLATNGIAALIFDPIDQGERFQYIDKNGNSPYTSVSGHTMLGVGSILLGRSTARFEIWDAIRCIDYLQSRTDIDPERIGCMGISGGGTQTSYLMALDGRIKAAAPSCYITSFWNLLSTIGPQDAEQNIYGQIAFGMDHSDYIIMRATKPTLICAATEDFFDICGTWNTFRFAKRLYTKMGFPECLDITEYDGKHEYSKMLRESSVRWMMRWLAGKNDLICEFEIEVPSNKKIQCTQNGQILLNKEERSTYDLNRDYENQLSKIRSNLWSTVKPELLNSVRKIAQIRELAELPEPQVTKLEQKDHGSYKEETLELIPEDGICLGASLYTPKEPSGGALLYVSDTNNNQNPQKEIISEYTDNKQYVMVIEIRGLGKTKPTRQTWTNTHFGRDGQDFLMGYLLGKSYVGMRAEDILVSALWLKKNITERIHLIAEEASAIAALHAAALEKDLFESVKLKRILISWSNIIQTGISQNQLTNTVHGALTTYDLPDLANILKDKLIIEEYIDSIGNPVTK